MDPQTEAHAMVQAWISTQQHVWESWLTVMCCTNTPYDDQAWETSLAAWNQAVLSALEHQVVWMQFWTDRVVLEDTPNEKSAWLRRTLSTLELWANTQAQLCERQFTLLRHLAPPTTPLDWSNREAQQILHDWQLATRQSLEAQLRWIQLWTVAQAQGQPQAYAVARLA